ncbi:ribonuclease II [Planomonospora sphaerica]|uniref:Ribonuclease II n=1 Tax=Planomonospora sphaerica TaxID=161355 RepID=A0A161MFW9_9ACTN|nr:hypothetical protein [Planomonospora sphaerica]GAT71463.1 ribonuclease II [Planomonospora sphaerica]
MSIHRAADSPQRPTEHHPVSVLNEQGRISPLEWNMVSGGPPHALAFTSTVAMRPAGGERVVSASGTGASKAVARAAAAAALLTELDAR